MPGFKNDKQILNFLSSLIKKNSILRRKQTEEVVAPGCASIQQICQGTGQCLILYLISTTYLNMAINQPRLESAQQTHWPPVVEQHDYIGH